MIAVTTLYKPAGLPVFPPHSDPAGDCLLRHLLADQPWRRAIHWPPGFAGGIAHRLDNATSGAVIVADTLEELAHWRELFRGHHLTKTYLMLAAKDVPWQRNQCTAAIAHHPRKRDRMVVERGKNTPHRGKWYPAHTTFRRVRGHLWEVQITTGIMHQIRVHAAFLGIPLLGDSKYGGGKGPSFFLHHVGLTGPSGLHSDPVPLPDWAASC
jgi:23S rRNA-/tRNA-specific pseudouridylate synthase